MLKVLVLDYSAYGHVEAFPRVEVDVKRVPELVPDSVAQRAHFKLDQPAPIARVDDLVNYDAIIVGTGTRFGRISSQPASYGFAGQWNVAEVTGGSPYGATTIAGDGSRQPTSNELEGARYQGRRVAESAKKLRA